VRLVALGAEPRDDLNRFTTPEERLAMVWALTVEAWALGGRPMPAYPRTAAPVRLRRLDRRRSETPANEDFQDMLAALLASGVRFLMVGRGAPATGGVELNPAGTPQAPQNAPPQNAPLDTGRQTPYRARHDAAGPFKGISTGRTALVGVALVAPLRAGGTRPRVAIT
jgi:hypothetical protein